MPAGKLWGGVLACWLWEQNPSHNLPPVLRISGGLQTSNWREIEHIRKEYGIRLSDGWNGGFGAESNLPQDREEAT